MFRRRKGSSGPGLEAVSVDVTGWTPGDCDAFRKTWHQPGASLWLCHFPVPPDLPHAVGDSEALHEEFERSSAQDGMAVVEVSWVEGPHGLVIAQIVLKAVMPQGSVTYIGSLIVPFADCSWVIRMQAVEGSPTGLRETLWLERHLAQGGDLGEVGFARPVEQPGRSGAISVRRMPSDDAEWDDIVPQHPLSRVRAWLAICRQSLSLEPEVLSLAPFR